MAASILADLARIAVEKMIVSVIGGGLVGLSISYGLARAGLRVAVCDEGDQSYRASRGNFGLVWVQGKGVDAPAYAREILAGVADHLADIDETIETYSQEWTLGRMPAVDRAIARVAVWEIVWNDDVDAPVAVDEAMTLARMLSTDESPRFMNGLLGRIGDLADTLR